MTIFGVTQSCHFPALHELIKEVENFLRRRIIIKGTAVSLKYLRLCNSLRLILTRRPIRWPHRHIINSLLQTTLAYTFEFK